MSDLDYIEATAAALRAARRPVLAYDDGAPVAEPPEWLNDVPPEFGGTTKAEPEALPMLSLSELREKAAAVSWLVKGVVPMESIGIVFGASGAFKSFVAIDLALHVAHGLQWLGKKTKKAPVVFIAAEGGAGLWRRIEAWHVERRLKWEDAALYVVPVAVDLSAGCARVVDAAVNLGITPGLIAVDTLSQTFSGEENSAAEMSTYLRELGLWFRESWRCAVLVIHHSGHVATERPRGSSAIRANVDFMFGVHRAEKEMLATLSCVKQKDGELLPDQTFALTVHELGRDEDGDAITGLVARAVMSEQEKTELVQHEAAKGRSGRNALLLNLAQNGMKADELRKAFYEDCDLADADARRQAYFRAMDWAKKAGLVEIVEGYVLLSKAALRDK